LARRARISLSEACVARLRRVDVGLFSYLHLADPGWNMSSAYLLAASLAMVMAFMLLKESRCA